ncbi:MAG: hypothetical protein AAGA99_21605 [Actinomycetota bacterium]
MRGETAILDRSVVWPTWIALVVIWAAAVANQLWAFALVFLVWAVADVRAGESAFVQRIVRSEHPVLFWALVGSWVALAILWVVAE